MKNIMFFDVKAKHRRKIAKAIGPLDQFSGCVWRAIARDDVHAAQLIHDAQIACGDALKFLVTDELVFANGWGICTPNVTFGGPFNNLEQQP